MGMDEDMMLARMAAEAEERQGWTCLKPGCTNSVWGDQSEVMDISPDYCPEHDQD